MKPYTQLTPGINNYANCKLNTVDIVMTERSS